MEQDLKATMSSSAWSEDWSWAWETAMSASAWNLGFGVCHVGLGREQVLEQAGGCQVVTGPGTETTRLDSGCGCGSGMENCQAGFWMWLRILEGGGQLSSGSGPEAASLASDCGLQFGHQAGL